MTSRLLIPALTSIALLTTPCLAQTGSAQAVSPTAQSMQHHMLNTAHQGRHASLYRRAERKLKSLGDYAGPVDGRSHASYVRALKTFQTAHRLPATGRLTLKTRRALGI